ncbi:hypothetical protein KJ359_006448 [Pestalotiopsis sp. 9143b]|nr:hypothetical protein KJ359_006448 [Pestalotiopsis sp. 9143b]
MLTSKILLMAAAISGIADGAPASNAATTAALDIGDGPGPNMVPFNTTMPDGSVEVVWLHEAFQPVAGPVQEPRRIEERLKWNPNGTPNQCGDSTFVDRTTTGSPAQIDCMAIVNQMIGGPGYWQLLQGGDLHANGDYCRVAYHNECVFGVKTTVIFGLYLGSEDIRDVVTEALHRREGDPRVQFEGSFPCNSPNGQGGVIPGQPHTQTSWAIFKPLGGTAPNGGDPPVNQTM